MTISNEITEVPSGFLAAADAEIVTCYYKNETGKLQIIRVPDIRNRYFERTVFPSQQLIFESFADAYLEVHTCEQASAVLTDRIPCQRLAMRVN